MKRLAPPIVCLLVLLSAWALPGSAFQAPANRPSANQDAENKKKNAEEEESTTARLPDDKRLLALHRDFVKKAEILAEEYEKKKEWGKAKDVYGEILKLVPKYAPAVDKYKALHAYEANAQVRVVDISATEGWQDTGIIVTPGKPLRLRAAGTWTFTLSVEISPEGIKIPKELRDYNLGCLIGVIDTGNPENSTPFVVGEEKVMEPEQAGKLMLRMYDIAPDDNTGSLKVEIRGTFEDRNRD